MKIEIDLKVILLLILFIFTSQIEIYSIFIFFILLHELAHVLVGYSLGMKISKIKLNLFGFSAQMHSYKTKKNYIKIITYLAGPVLNLICAIIFFSVMEETEMKANLVYTNILLFVFNLLPIMPLDGGKILKEILKFFYGNKKASIIMINLSKVLLAIISFSYSIFILKLKNIAILLLIIYMWYLYSIEARKVSTLERMYKIIEKV